MVFDLGIESFQNQPPVPRFVRLILFQAIYDKAEEIIFVMNEKVETQSQIEELPENDADDLADVSPVSRDAFTITFKLRDKQLSLAPAPGRLFEPAMRIFLNAAEIPYWTKTPVSGELQTLNPVTRWAIRSDNLAAHVHLLRLQ